MMLQARAALLLAASMPALCLMPFAGDRNMHVTVEKPEQGYMCGWVHAPLLATLPPPAAAACGCGGH